MNGKMAYAFLMGLVLGFIFLNIPPALDLLMALYGAAYTQISILISALLWSHALMQIPAGLITDRLGLRRAFVICLAFMAGGGLVPALAPSLEMAVAGRVLTGIGTGLGFIVTMKLIVLYAPGGRVGTYQAFFAGSFSIGSILAYLVVPLISGLGWKWVYLAATAGCLPLIGWLLPLDLARPSSARPQPLSLAQVMRLRTGWVIGFYHALSYGSMINLGNWVPTLLTEVWQGSSAVQYAWGGAAVMLISGLGRLSGGFILFRLKPLFIANGSLLILLFLFSGLFGLHSPEIVLPLALLAAWFASINFGAFFQIASRAVAAESLGLFFGFINLLANLGAIVFTLAFGWMKDTFGTLSGGFGLMAALCVLALVLGRPALQAEVNRPRTDRD
jgi:predicted MFS family arabinose efflux permease